MKLKEYLKQKKLTIGHFAHILGVHAQTLYQITSFYRRPSPELAKLIEASTLGEVKRLDLLYPEETGEKVKYNPNKIREKMYE